MKYTLLELTQDILTNLGSDEINSISDTTESMQVATIIRQTYFNMLSKYDLPENNQLFQLDASTNPDQPTLMFRPEGISRIEWIKYFDSNPADGTDNDSSFSHDLDLDLTNNANTSGTFGPGYLDVKVLSIEDFLRMTNAFNPGDSNVDSFTLAVTNQSTTEANNFTFYYKNDKQPQYCCVISNYFVVFDSYDSSQDSTLQSSKTQGYGWVLPVFSLTDTFTPPLDDLMFPLLLNEAKSLAFLELKYITHQKAEQEVSRQLSALQKFKAANKKPTEFERLANFGRMRNTW